MTDAGAAVPALLGRLGPLCAAMALGFLTVSIPLAVLAVYVHETLGFPIGVAGLAVGLQSFATILTRAPAGRMVDRTGAKPTLQRGLGMAAASGFALLVASMLGAWPTLALLVLLGARLLLGVGESLLVTGVLSWAMIRAGSGRAGLAMSWNGMAQYTALAAGAPIGFALFGGFGLKGVAIAGIILPLVALGVVAGLTTPPPGGDGTRLPLAGVALRITPPGLALMLAGIGFAAISAFASLDFRAHDWPGADRALLTFGLCFVAVRVALGGLPDRRGGRAVAALSMTAEALGQLALWAAPGPAVALVGAGLTGAGCSLVFPSLGLIALRRVPGEARGVAVGVFAAFQDLAIGLTGPVLGTLAGLAGYPAIYLAGAVAAAAGVLVSLTLDDATPGSG